MTNLSKNKDKQAWGAISFGYSCNLHVCYFVAFLLTFATFLCYLTTATALPFVRFCDKNIYVLSEEIAHEAIAVTFHFTDTLSESCSYPEHDLFGIWDQVLEKECGRRSVSWWQLPQEPQASKE